MKRDERSRPALYRLVRRTEGGWRSRGLFLRTASTFSRSNPGARNALAIESWGKGMLGTTLRYDYEVRDEKGLFKNIPTLRVKKDMVELASHILDRKAGRSDPGEFKDEYELALRKLVKRKAAGHTIAPAAEETAPANAINLMDALRESMKPKIHQIPDQDVHPKKRRSGERPVSAMSAIGTKRTSRMNVV